MREISRRVVEHARSSTGPMSAWVSERDEGGAPDLLGEMTVLLLTSYETTAIALVWTMLLLSRHPEERERVEAELAAALAGRAPRADDLPKLPYLRAVIDESLRLYPPAWSLLRRAVNADVISGVPIPAGSMVALYPFTLHRHPAYWPRPDEFDPGRFLGGAGERPVHAYIPFGAGPRVCVGARLALLEMPTILAVVMQRWRLDASPDRPVELDALINLRPKGDLLLRLSRRRSGA
jgi:cytochrome P450